jgi:hypothetical protein
MTTKSFSPGTHVRTPDGIGWVNLPPPGQRPVDRKVFVRLGDDTVRLISERDIEAVNF